MLDDPTQILRDSFVRLLTFAGADRALEGSMPTPPKGRTCACHRQSSRINGTGL